MWKQEHPSLLERQIADLNIKMAVVLALVSLYGCMQTARYEHAGLQTLLSFFFFVVNRHLVVLVLPMGLQWWVQSQCALQSACRLCLLHLPHFQRQVLDSIWHGRPGVFVLRHWDTPFLVIHRPLPSRGEGCGVSTRGEFGKLHLR